MRERATMPRVSVITVVKNGERYLAEAIRSVLAQEALPGEIIVVDGQSADSTASIAHSFPEVCYVRQCDQGLANARNIGIDAAQGELIAFLDHDDLWAAGKLLAQVQYMVEHPALQYTTTLMKFVVDAEALPWAEMDRAELESPRDGSTPSALVARRGLFAEIGRFDPAYTIGCDADFFARARDCNIPTAQLPQVLLFKRLHQTNLSVNAVVNGREMLRIARQSLARKQRLQHGKNPAHH